MADAAAAEQLRQYLFELKPQARALLVTELERAALRGEAPPGTVAILEQLRETARQRGAKFPRVGNAPRLFFSFAEPFLVGGTSQRKWIGRIPRASLDPIWNWICRDLMPIEAQTYTERVDRHLAANETGEAELMASAFQDLAGHRLHECLASGSDDRALRRIAVQIGTPHALDETRELATILRIRDALGVIGSRLPASINNLTEDQLANAGALLGSQIARPRDVFVHAVLIVRSRLASPWQLIRLAVQAAGTDVAARVAATPYAIAVDIALNDIDLLIGSLHNALKRQSDDVADLLKQIHDAVRGLRTEVDFPADAAWGRQLASARAEASTLLQAEIENVPSHVRRLLRAREARDSQTVLDAGDVAEIEAKLTLVAACRNYAGELAISEVTRRVHSELKAYFDSGAQLVLDRLRNAPAAERAARQSQVEAAIRFCARLFGPEYAGLLTKAAEIAAKGEQKAAKA